MGAAGGGAGAHHRADGEDAVRDRGRRLTGLYHMLLNAAIVQQRISGKKPDLCPQNDLFLVTS